MNVFWSIAVVCAFGVGFLAGYWECKIQARQRKRKEDLRIAITDFIGSSK